MHQGVGKRRLRITILRREKDKSIDLVHSLYVGVTLCNYKNPLCLNAW